MQRIILTVSQLNRATNQLLSGHFLSIFVEGEISNLSAPSSGHLYFSLKDAGAQVRCAMFRTQQRRMEFKPENGNRVIVKAQVSLYEPRGDFQLIVEQLEAAGDGALRRAFEALKLKLSEEGLFDTANKQSLPALPETIGIITSPSGAAIRDILTVLRRRFPSVPVIIYPVAVQGDNAKYEITRAITLANEQKQCDVIILGRGGGSLEDLWAFNLCQCHPGNFSRRSRNRRDHRRLCRRFTRSYTLGSSRTCHPGSTGVVIQIHSIGNTLAASTATQVKPKTAVASLVRQTIATAASRPETGKKRATHG
jgi:exonuclease VII large subunit